MNDDIFLDETEVAARTGYSVKWVQTARTKGGFIPFCKLGTRTVRYRKSAVDAWIDSHKSFESTSEYPPDETEPEQIKSHDTVVTRPEVRR